jgi:hypothetical protein
MKVCLAAEADEVRDDLSVESSHDPENKEEKT